MTATYSPSQEVIRCRNTADFLAALPLLVGFTASNSIFIVLFTGKLAGRTIRLDLPADESPAVTTPLLNFISETLSSLHEADPISPAIVITTDVPFPAEGPAPWHRFARRLERRLRRDGFPPRELCCLAADAWVGFLDPQAPAGGRSLSEINQSPVTNQHRAKLRDIRSLESLGAIPECDPERTAAVRSALAALPPYAATASNDWMLDVAAVCATLRNARSRLDPLNVARLIRTLAHSDRWLVLTLGILTRPRFAYELATEEDVHGTFEGIPLDLDDDDHRPPVFGWSIRRILTNICPDFTDHDRLRPILDVLLDAIADTPKALRPSVCALSALLWWLHGNQTVAHRHLQEAFALDPKHALSLMVERIVQVPLYPSTIRASRSAA